MKAPGEPAKRFPVPGRVERTPGGYMVVDRTGRALVYTYGEDDPGYVAWDKLTVDEARRIAAGVARLPELLARKAQEQPTPP